MSETSKLETEDVGRVASNAGLDGMAKERSVKLDAERYDWMRNGGWEVLQDPKYWLVDNGFDGAVDAARIDTILTGIANDV